MKSLPQFPEHRSEKAIEGTAGCTFDGGFAIQLDCSREVSFYEEGKDVGYEFSCEPNRDDSRKMPLTFPQSQTEKEMDALVWYLTGLMGE